MQRVPPTCPCVHVAFLLASVASSRGFPYLAALYYRGSILAQHGPSLIVLHTPYVHIIGGFLYLAL